MTGTRPENVGILAAEVYFPSTYVSQEELEAANGVAAGKYTIGLGQDAMAFTGDREDINSVAMTAVAGLLEKYEIPREQVGRLEVGTETLIDKSKSTKTALMELFEGSGNTDVEGCTTVNACYGGTAALLNAVAWVESSGWDGRYAVVVAADIAVYASGPARPTGGCGAVAVLVGPDAPLVIDMKTRATHACHVWDFFKPNMNSEYPEVNGALSQTCYLRALDDCYNRMAAKSTAEARAAGGDADEVFTVAGSTDHIVFHSPYNKLVQKSFARLLYCDARRLLAAGRELPAELEPLRPWLDKPVEQTYTDRGLENALKGAAGKLYSLNVAPSCGISKQIGNTYTASVFANLVNLVDSFGAALQGKRVFAFSYGSGALATMYGLHARETSTGAFSLRRIKETVGLQARLADREKTAPSELTKALDARAAAHHAVPYRPRYPVDRLFPGTYYLEEVAEDHTRRYLRRPLDAPHVKGGRLAPLKLPSPVDEANGTTDPGATDSEEDSSEGSTAEDKATLAPAATSVRKASLPPASPRWAHTVPKVVVTGVAAGLPGQAEVFQDDNLQRLLAGQNCLTPLGPSTKAALLEKNVVQLQRDPQGGKPIRVPIQDPAETIQLAARLGRLDMTEYGVSPSIAATMDKAVQVAVAAGLVALKDAGLVTGEGPDGWRLPADMRDTTGVMYASSFPALDAAIGEVMRFLQSRCITRAKKSQLLQALRQRLQAASPTGAVAREDEEAIRGLEMAVLTKSVLNLTDLARQAEEQPVHQEDQPITYEFDRKFLFRVLVLGNAQLAQIVGARGPNMQTNAACAGSTQAVAMAQDMLQLGRCERIVVIAGDDASGEALIPWLGNGFRALGAASIASTPEGAALPFQAARNGMLLGAGGIGMVLETEDAAARRHCVLAGPRPGPPAGKGVVKARLLETQISNSAHHGASMDRQHIATELERFLITVKQNWGITREQLATKGVYFSHETCTHATPTASCSYNEVFALRKCFGDELLEKFVIINTKGFTGHPMGVSFEDVTAVEALWRGVVPPTANLSGSEVDPLLGKLRLSPGGPYKAKYALRFAAGFGSQVAFALYSSATLH